MFNDKANERHFTLDENAKLSINTIHEKYISIETVESPK